MSHFVHDKHHPLSREEVKGFFYKYKIRNLNTYTIQCTVYPEASTLIPYLEFCVSPRTS